MTWIPMTERLPKTGELIAAAYAGKGLVWAGPYHHKITATHWMPLPEVPK